MEAGSAALVKERRTARAQRRPLSAVLRASRSSPDLRVRGYAVPVCDALEWFAAQPSAERFYWERPDRSEAVVGSGAAWTCTLAGADRFERAAEAVAALRERLVVEVEAKTEALSATTGPLLVGGFAFASDESSRRWRGFPAGRLVLPERLLWCRDGHTWLWEVESMDNSGSLVASAAGLRKQRGVPEIPLSQPREEGADQDFSARQFQHGNSAAFAIRSERPPTEFCDLVSRARAAVRAAHCEKLVVARACAFRQLAEIDVVRTLSRLRARYPNATLFAVGRGGRTFLGATPEPLLRVENGMLTSAAVAGTAPRGRTPEEDAAIAAALRENKKEGEEHAAVVHFLREQVGRFCTSVEVPEAPQLLRNAVLQHLHTPIVGWLRGGVSALELLAALHPSPAVAGAPRGEALSWLRENENLDRGWYAGPVGWLQLNGEGDFVVALRSALMDGARARLFAGAGVVAGSDPEAEFGETRLKLSALADVLLEY